MGRDRKAGVGVQARPPGRGRPAGGRTWGWGRSWLGRGARSRSCRWSCSGDSDIAHGEGRGGEGSPHGAMGRAGRGGPRCGLQTGILLSSLGGTSALRPTSRHTSAEEPKFRTLSGSFSSWAGLTADPRWRSGGPVHRSGPPLRSCALTVQSEKTLLSPHLSAAEDGSGEVSEHLQRRCPARAAVSV